MIVAMAEGTRVGRLESELREEREQRVAFQDRIEGHLAKMFDMIEKLNQRGEEQDSASIRSQNRAPPRDFKIDLPAFNGEHVDDWLFRIEEYFDLVSTPLDHRVKIASLHMTEPAYAWYKWLVCNNYTNDWVIFSEVVRKRFGTSLFENPQEALKELRQTGTVAEYQSQFEALSTRVQGLSEAWLVSFFVAGLEDHLKCQLRLAKPSTFPEAVALARLHEQHHLALKQSLRPPPVATTLARPRVTTPAFVAAVPPRSNPSVVGYKPAEPTASAPHTEATPSSSLSTANSGSGMVSNKPSFKKFSAAELRDRRKLGLCYYCDEKYSPTHTCRAQCYALLGKEDLDEMLGLTVEEGDQTEADTLPPGVSFNALTGDYSPSTLRLKGNCLGKFVNILVDSGSSFNFVKPTVAQRIGLTTTRVNPFKVFVGSGDFIWCDTKSSAVPVTIQGVSFTVDLFHLAIAGADIVFGITWMRSLGRVLTDYHQLTIEFMLDGCHTTLHAESLLKSEPLTDKSMRKLVFADNIVQALQLQFWLTSPRRARM